ncbi:MAG: FkbM family methyltransferase [Brumimicrobium sp.]
MLRSIRYIKNQIVISRKVNNLNFTATGIDDDGDRWIEYDGLRFYGAPTIDKLKKYYNLLSNKTKQKLPFECFRVAQDIQTRYVEGGLKYGGPFKQDFYQVKEGDVVAEMGAFMGVYILKLCKQVGRNGKVVAIEPLEDNLYYLRKNVEYNNMVQCQIVPKGVWKEKTTINFNRKATDSQSGSIVIGERNEDHSLPVDTLENIMSDLNISHCDFMIVQLNGVEAIALEGLTSFNPENIAIAARYDIEEEDTVIRIKNHLLNRGYDVNIHEKRFIYANVTKD